MNDTNHSYGEATRQLVASLCQQQPGKKLVFLRHSARHYDLDNPVREPFLGLTETGKQLAWQWGHCLPAGLQVNFLSSFISRCLETAYLIDKGYTAGGGTTSHPCMENALAPYYVRDAPRLLDNHLKIGHFYEDWFAGRIPTDIIDPPRQVARRLAGLWKKRLQINGPDSRPALDVCVTHDWNVYIALEAFYGLLPEDCGQVYYLDGMVVFGQNDAICLQAPGRPPVTIAKDWF